MTEAITTSKAKPRQATNAELAEQTKEALLKFKNGKQVKVSIPAVLKNGIGENLTVIVNGVRVDVPVDGEEHAIPEPHADQVKQMLKNLK